MPNASYIAGDGAFRQRSLSAGDGSAANPDVADFSPKYLNDTPITGTTLPTGGSGVIGWISSVYQKLISGVVVTGTVTAVSPRASLQYVSGTVNITGDNTIVTSPGAGLSIYITHIVLQNESTVATTMTIKDTAVRFRYFGPTQGSGTFIAFPNKGEIKLIANTPLILNLSGNNICGYSIGYFIA